MAGELLRAPVHTRRVRWPSVEHYYQAQKYSGTEAADRIRAAETPAKARQAGQDRSVAPRDDWEEVKVG